MEPTRFLEGITHYFTTLICIFMFQCCQFEILRLYNTYTPVGEKGSCLARGRGECLGLRLYNVATIPVGEKGSCLVRERDECLGGH